MTHCNLFGHKSLPIALPLSIVIMGSAVGCGAQLRPDGPKRVVFNEPDGTQRIVQVAPATELRQAAIDQLMRMTSDESPEIRANAIEALSPVTSQVEPVVALALTDPNPGVRTVAVLVAGRSNLSSLAPTIRGMLNDESPFVRSGAMFALGSFGDESNLTELSILLLENPSIRVRSQAAFVLGELGEPTAIPMLNQASSVPVPNASVIEKKIFRLQIADRKSVV